MNLKDLAALLGLSQTTVSRALNGYPEVSERTRARVLAAAAAHGYVPDPRARSLATGRAMTVGFVIPIDSRHERVNPVFGDFVAGAGDLLSARGYDIILSLTTGQDEADAYRMIAARGRVDGLIIQAPLTGDWRGEILQELGLPYEVKLSCMMEPIDMPVTRRMSKDAKTEYLDEMARHWSAQGVRLTDPEDLKWSAS